MSCLTDTRELKVRARERQVQEGQGGKFGIFWMVRANSVKRLTRAEAEQPAVAARSEQASDEDIPF
jgi:hypothetical protein